MKLRATFAISLLAVITSRAYAAPLGYVVASNLTDAQTTTTSRWAVGLALAPHFAVSSAGQAFVPTSSGSLTTVDALVRSSATYPESVYPPLNVSIYTSSAGIPITQLANLSFSRSDFLPLSADANEREIFDFSPFHVVLETNHEYMITFTVPFAGVLGGSTPPYLAGSSPTSVASDHSLSLGINVSTTPDGVHRQKSSFLYSE